MSIYAYTVKARKGSVVKRYDPTRDPAPFENDIAALL